MLSGLPSATSCPPSPEGDHRSPRVRFLHSQGPERKLDLFLRLCKRGQVVRTLLFRQRAILWPDDCYCCSTSCNDPAAKTGRQGVHGRSFRVATRVFARPWDCTDGVRLEDGKEHHEADRPDAESQGTQNFFHYQLLGIFRFALEVRISWDV